MIRYQTKTRTAAQQTCMKSVESRLADKMREMAFAGENVTPETLENHGFSREVVAKLGQRAAALARRRSIKRIDSHA